MAKGPKSHHVVPNQNGGWDVKRGGGERASARFDAKAHAIDRGREISRNNRDGRIASSDSHGNDPNPPRG